MAKPAVAGRVKTRLIGTLTAEQAAGVHQVMLDCVLERLGRHSAGRHVLAMDAPGGPRGPGGPGGPAPSGWEMTDQGAGDLGERIAHVWQSIGSGRAVFFGVDSPDLPPPHLAAICAALTDHDAAVGPVGDGGYWAVAANRPQPQLLTGVDWGTASVYHQTLERAGRYGIKVASLPAWHDVDDADDLAALRQRIAGSDEPALQHLSRRLDQIMEDCPS